jgi:flagellin
MNQRVLDKSMTRLSTGLRINSAKDDAAGLAISQRMTADIRGLGAAIRNENDGISLAQTAETALGEVSNMLQRMRELSVQSASGTLTNSNRQALQAEMAQLVAEVDNVSKTANFNGIKLLDGSSSSLALQTGTRMGETVSIQLNKMDSKALGLQGYSVTGQVTSGRVGLATALTNQASAVLINGKNYSTAAGHTAYRAIAAGNAAGPTNVAKELATAINLNANETRVVARAFNSVTSVVPSATSFVAGALNINNTAIGAATSVDELVTNINRDAAGVTAVRNSDGTITLSNDTGNDIYITGTAEETAGFSETKGLTGAGGLYTGFVSLESMDAADIKIEAKNKANGYTENIGALADVKLFGFNQSVGNTKLSGEQVLWIGGDQATPTDYGKLTQDDNVLINGEVLGLSADGSASAKAVAINALTSKTGVVASALTKVAVTVNMTGTLMTAINDAADATRLTINGTSVGDLSNGVVNLDNLVTRINERSPPGVTASSEAGVLVLTSTTGANISIFDGTNAFVTAANTYSNEAAFAPSVFTGDINFSDGFAQGAAPALNAVASALAPAGRTFGGQLTLTSNNGSTIKVTGKSLSLEKLGLSAQGGTESTLGGAISITSQNSSKTAIVAVDAAINKINLKRADLGAVQSRLEVVVNNLSSSTTNLSTARSRIMDADYSQETTELSKALIIRQAATAILAQANQAPQTVLALLKT